MDGVFSPGTVMVHAAYTPLTDAAVMSSGWSVGFTATAHRPALTALKTGEQQIEFKQLMIFSHKESRHYFVHFKFSFIHLTYMVWWQRKSLQKGKQALLRILIISLLSDNQ